MSRTIPSTSHAANKAMTKELREQHNVRILDALSTLQEAIAEKIAQKAGMDKVQVSRRLNELEASQLVVKTGGTKPTSSGRQAQVYKLHCDEWFRRYQEGEYEEPVKPAQKPEKSAFQQFLQAELF